MEITDKNKFFKYVWRFNALVIAGGVVLFLLLGSIAAFEILRREFRERKITGIINLEERNKTNNAEEQAKIKTEFSLGELYALDNTYVRVPVYQSQTYDFSYYSKTSGRNLVNYLFLNNRDGLSTWLMQTNDQLFLSNLVIFDKPENPTKESRKAVGILYTIVEKDTNGDNRLSERDKVSIGSSSLDGSNYKKLIDNIDNLYDIEQIANTVVILYKKNDKIISEIYAVPSMTKLFENPIPALKPQ